jgi:hypothetical protein
MKPSSLGKASCIVLGLEAGWCLVVWVWLPIVYTSSLWTFNQSFMMLTIPVVGLLSIFGLLCGLSGSFAPNPDKTLRGTHTYIQFSINSFK